MILFVPHLPGTGSYVVTNDGVETLYRGTYNECRSFVLRSANPTTPSSQRKDATMTISEALEIIAEMIPQTQGDQESALQVAANVLDDVLHGDVEQYA